MSVGHGLDVLLLCYDEELQPWQKAVFEKHKQAEKKHEEDLKNYKQEMRQFYAGLGVTYNKKNGESSAMEQQVSESNNGVTRLVTTLPVTKSPIANPIGAPVTSVGNVRFAPQTKQVKKIITPVMNAQSPTIKQLQPKQYQPYKAPTQISKPAPVITAVKPFPKITMQSVLTTPVTVASKVPSKHLPRPSPNPH
ncbi:hypothetical protein BSL78_06241 [Apostichopus japonicus]|uniref:Uncharacterized protein n=1 Tax=Stichopus japonicus TaxID=307972 RepID=A0A2G8L9A9_STIJA|nr:hypothetical protein BSL78_06241 [Apostichopus japonicus]